MTTTHTAQPPPPHPTDATAPPLPPQPVLLLATSDGKLRGYTLGDTDRTDSCVTEPTAPTPLDGSLKAVLVGSADPSVEAGAAAGEMPPAEVVSEAGAEEGEGSTGSSPAQASVSGRMSVARALEAKAQQAALPDSDDEASDADSAAVTSGTPAADSPPLSPIGTRAAPAPAATLAKTVSTKSTTSAVAPVAQRGTFSFAPKPLDVAQGAAQPSLPTPRMPTTVVQQQPSPPPTPPLVQPQPMSPPAAQLTGAIARLVGMTGVGGYVHRWCIGRA